MKLNDWKKINEYSWSKKNDTTIEIIKNYDKNNNLDFYSVEIMLWETEDELTKWIKTKRFRKELQAIAFAKEYMRTH